MIEKRCQILVSIDQLLLAEALNLACDQKVNLDRLIEAALYRHVGLEEDVVLEEIAKPRLRDKEVEISIDALVEQISEDNMQPEINFGESSDPKFP